VYIILRSGLTIGADVAGCALHHPQADASSVAGVAVLVRAVRLNVNTVAFSQEIGIVINGYFHASLENNAELVTFMAKRHFSVITARFDGDTDRLEMPALSRKQLVPDP